MDKIRAILRTAVIIICILSIGVLCITCMLHPETDITGKIIGFLLCVVIMLEALNSGGD